MTIRVRIEDGVWKNGYKYKTTLCQDGLWTVIPRVGDSILDGNEFEYVVKKVVWYDPQDVRIHVERFRG